MGDAADTTNTIGLTAEIVSAYVSNNTVASADIPALINQVHTALLRVTSGEAQPALRAAQAGCADQAFDQSRLHRLPGGRQEVQVAQAPSAHAVQHDAGAIPGEMEPAGATIRWWRRTTPPPARNLPSRWAWASSAAGAGKISLCPGVARRARLALAVSSDKIPISVDKFGDFLRALIKSFGISIC